MKIVLAIDSFKGCLTSAEAEISAYKSIRKVYPECQIDIIPVADGGEGTLGTLISQEQAYLQTISAHNPCMEIISATYGISQNKGTAFIEMAAISGLPLIKEEQRNPMETTSYGTGELICDALERGCKHFIIGIGGSATNDAGTGLLQALGYQFLDEQKKPLGQGGKILSKIRYIDGSQKHPLLNDAHFTIACDVRNPFYGPNGAAYIFARQKGANNQTIEILDKGMKSFARIIEKETGKDISRLPGSGAAGGIGGSLAALLGAELKSGANLLLDRCLFQERIANADLIITGEGKMDRQSIMGKITGEIAKRAAIAKCPVIAITGRKEDTNVLLQAGFQGIYTIQDKNTPIKEAMEPDVARQNIQKTITKIIPNHFSERNK